MQQHCTPEDLALAALGEPLPAGDAAHLADCRACTDEVASLRRSVDALAVPAFAATGSAVAPPPHVWAAIAAATGVESGPAAPPTPAVPAAPAAPVRPAAEAPAPPAEVVPLRRMRSRLLLAAAASLVVGAGIGAGAVALRDDDGDDEAVVALAGAQLDPLGENSASGEAEVVERPDGSRVLRLELDADSPQEGYLEVWLIDTAVEGMVSVGVVGAGTEELELPPDLDIGEFPIVDVSVEPLDGDPTHSGVSIARGQLA